jgi:hypothetical protein
MLSLVVKPHAARDRGTGQTLKDDFLFPLKVKMSCEMYLHIVHFCMDLSQCTKITMKCSYKGIDGASQF